MNSHQIMLVNDISVLYMDKKLLYNITTRKNFKIMYVMVHYLILLVAIFLFHGEAQTKVRIQSYSF